MRQLLVSIMFLLSSCMSVDNPAKIKGEITSVGLNQLDVRILHIYDRSGYNLRINETITVSTTTQPKEEYLYKSFSFLVEIRDGNWHTTTYGE